MEPMMTEKNEYADLIPYRKKASEFEYFLQKRDSKAILNAGLFACFGGSIHGGEKPTVAVLRESREELRYSPHHIVYFSKFETAVGIVHVFIEEVGSDFESLVNVQEGEGGKFFTSKDILYSPDVSLLAQLVIRQLDKSLCLKVLESSR